MAGKQAIKLDLSDLAVGMYFAKEIQAS